MLITRECDYAVRVLRAMAEEKRVSVNEICEKELITAPFAYKILKKLQKIFKRMGLTFLVFVQVVRLKSICLHCLRDWQQSGLYFSRLFHWLQLRLNSLCTLQAQSRLVVHLSWSWFQLVSKVWNNSKVTYWNVSTLDLWILKTKSSHEQLRGKERLLSVPSLLFFDNSTNVFKLW